MRISGSNNSSTPHHLATSAAPDSSGVAQVSPWDPASLLQSQLDALTSQNGIWLLPDRLDEHGRALYREDNAGLIKTANAAGVPVEYAYPKEARAYLGEHGAIEVITEVSVIAGDGVIGSAATWLCLLVYKKVKALLGGGSKAEIDESLVRVRIAEIRQNDGAPTVHGFEFTGPAGALETTLDQLLLARQLSPGAAPTSDQES